MRIKKTRGSVYHVLTFSLPLIISQACDSLMMLTDRYLLATVDPLFAAASMPGGMTAFLLWIFGAGLLGFATPLIAEYTGSNEPIKAKQVLIQALIIAAILSIPLALFGKTLGRYYFTWLKLPQEELPFVIAYLSVLMQYSFFVFAKVSFASFFSGIGKTKIVMSVNMLGFILNVPLSYFFIHGGVGESWTPIEGAALGTVFAEGFMTLAYLSLFIKGYAKGIKGSFDKPLFILLFKKGVWMGMEFFMLTLAYNTFLTLFHSYGIEAAKAIAVASTWSWLAVLPFFGLSIGVMSLVGNACGEKNFSLASHITLSAIKIALGLAIIASIIFIGFSDYLVQSFMIPTESSAYRLAIFMIGMLPLYCIFDAINFVFSAMLRAYGDTLFCLKINAAGQWICLLICFYGAFYLHFSPETLWSLFIITLSIQSLFLVCRYLKGASREEKSLKMN